MSNLNSNTAALQALLAKANALPEAGSGGITPSGTLAVTENGTYDVTNYSSAEVNVSAGTTETWTFTMEDGTTVTKAVVVA